MTSVTVDEIFCYSPPLNMQVCSFAWLSVKSEKITTEDKFENYGFFCKILYMYMAQCLTFSNFWFINLTTPSMIVRKCAYKEVHVRICK